MKITSFLFLVFLIFPCRASEFSRVADTRSFGLGGAGVTHTFTFNPALLALSTNKQAGVDIYNRFNVSGLQTLQASFIFCNDLLPAGINISSFGNDAYRENCFMLAVGKQISETVTVGIASTYLFIQSEGVDKNPSRLAIDAGVVIKTVDKLLIGISILNFPSVNLNVRDEQVKQTPVYNLRAGFNWNIIESCMLTSELICSEESPLTVNMGVEYYPYSSFSLRAGLQDNFRMPTCGIGYAFSRFTFQLATQFHPLLGTCTGLGLQVLF
ncbi:MAG: hypothetical protein PHH33_08800 [Parabacteroides sp.]|nr:hypothetical protein [Parabacteroides sp.]MDD4419721.1 hypothetical protein [Bacteroides graminisolvens]